jgi:hypothetical protein
MYCYVEYGRDDETCRVRKHTTSCAKANEKYCTLASNDSICVLPARRQLQETAGAGKLPQAAVHALLLCSRV